MAAHVLSLTSLFVVTVATLAVPGPTNFLIVQLAMRRGRPSGVAGAAGTALGCLVWCSAAALGLAAVFAAAPWLYKTIRVAGGLYLLWFAFRLWRAKPEPAEATPDAARGRGFWTGLTVCLTNPKSVLFFASIFSAYVGPDKPLWVHAAAVALVVATTFLWCSVLAWLFSTPGAAQAYGRAQRPLDRGAAALMGVFGASLLWTSG